MTSKNKTRTNSKKEVNETRSIRVNDDLWTKMCIFCIKQKIRRTDFVREAFEQKLVGN